MLRRHSRCGLAGALVLAVLATSARAEDPTPGTAPPANYIVATVNDEIITYADVMRTLEDAFRGIDANSKSAQEKQDDKDRLWTEALRNRADEILGLQDAKRLGIDASKSEVDEHFKERIAQLGGEANAQKHADERGFTLDEVRQVYHRAITIRKLIWQKIGLGTRDDSTARQDYDMYVGPAEMRRYYQDHVDDFRVVESAKLRWILIPRRPASERSPVRITDGGPELALARTIEMLLAKGADFGAVSRAFSREDVALRDGRFYLLDGNGEESDEPVWGLVECAKMERNLREAALTTEKGACSAPIVLEEGIAIVRVEDRAAAGTRSFEEVQGAIKARIERDRFEENGRRIFEALRRGARVEPPDLFTSLQKRQPLQPKPIRQP